MTVPSGWKQVPLSEVCRVVEGQVDPRDPQYRDLPHINGEVIESGTGRLLDLRTAAEDGLISGKYLFEPGMVLYSKLRPYLRKVTIAPSRGVCSADMYPLMFDPLTVDPRFAMFSLLAEPFTRYAVEESRRARMPKLNRAQLLAWEIPLPESVIVQRRIADSLVERLAVAQAAIRAATERLVGAKALFTAYLRSAFESSDREWATARLGDLCELLPSKSISTKGDTDVTAVTTGCLSETGFLATGLKAARMRKADVDDCLIKAGEVLVARSNTPELVGRASLYRGVPAGVVASDLTIRLWPRTKIGGDYIAAFLSYLYQTGHWRQRAGGASGTMKKITRAQLMSLPLKAPADPLASDAIVADLSIRLTGADELVSRCRDELSQLELLPAALLRTAFSAGT